MKYHYRLYLMLAVLLLAAPVQGWAQAGKGAPAPEAASPFPRIAYDERAWKPFESTEGGFTVAFPGKPGTETQTVQAAIGPLVNRIYGLDIGVSMFAASYSDIPLPGPITDKELINHALDAGRDRALQGAGGKLISESPLMLDGHYGRYVLYSDRYGLSHSQSYFVGTRLYQLIVATDDYRRAPAADQKFFKDIVNRFFTSFKLTQKTY